MTASLNGNFLPSLKSLSLQVQITESTPKMTIQKFHHHFQLISKNLHINSKSPVSFTILVFLKYIFSITYNLTAFHRQIFI